MQQNEGRCDRALDGAHDGTQQHSEAPTDWSTWPIRSLETITCASLRSATFLPYVPLRSLSAHSISKEQARAEGALVLWQQTNLKKITNCCSTCVREPKIKPTAFHRVRTKTQWTYWIGFPSCVHQTRIRPLLFQYFNHFIQALHQSTLSKHFIQAFYPITSSKPFIQSLYESILLTHFIKAPYQNTLSKHFIQALYQGISKSILEIPVTHLCTTYLT